ncbi:PilX N-terminal domain-containing pilus assembly protein [Pseudomonas chlororaphis]|uniref:pilus assembly PilX family protein n=1 Tax=Pseudomonas chlororaphis TaxID=587753 RepID=UPI00209B4493|nr:PilX N-terminal domain-containing pilus assembly protein [Pseudomonas chlororaphis]MCO7570806.1 PilX N-terminal domain-containing pilus assembly protein [Pseudomonas chlororaphis]MCO7588674.1 PilX N-terminal domain-containing pilus assembly protein [Pseudomonas chlororaphis]MCO7612016.1 PilX N-terminal domain-containing pilus assembly protein [Pseudomonas chlororaphis]
MLYPAGFKADGEQGMALLVSLVFLLVLSLIGLSSLQNATLQEKMAASLDRHNRSFQAAEAALRLGESAVRQGDYSLPPCADPVRCAPPAESTVVGGAGFNEVSAVTWIATGEGFYAVQNLGIVPNAVGLPPDTSATLYRVTAVGLAGQARSVLESIYAKY